MDQRSSEYDDYKRNSSSTMSPSYSQPPPPSLPPLHQAIPEFHSAMPSNRSVPESLSASEAPRYGDRYSPSNPPTRHYPVPASPGFDSGARMTPSPTRRLIEPPYGSAPLDPRRLSVMSTDSQYLPPVSSLSSRGSSFDMEADRNSHYGQVGLPPLSASTGMRSSLQYSTEGSRGWEENGRYHAYPQDYHRPYSADPNPYRGGSPGGPMMTGQYPPQYMMPSSHMDGVEGPDGRTGKRKRGNLPKHVTDILRQWFDEHENHPYPTEDEKQMLLMKTGLAMSQISNWFINARRRRTPQNANNRRD